ncbi:MAG: DEAD/DEAH box helicase [Salegentibacter sp.]|uniref:DEAD/DEAH box helicase n=1 Tax=Salegentibacter flavus TaxID=287099 RepID=A0A1I4ZR01_9FLAO|nr:MULTISPECIES: DEAD/DEAH box helicase [Salegentibacter]MDR9458340.1 DEAD/DEAH box helicase [Salegentibacter sp.]SFN52483.1 DEAD/DEAH box helicase [Salegentibacter flavus]
MSFKKLNPPLKEALERLGIEEPLPFQKKILPKIKSGRDLYIFAPENSGKTTALVISTIQKLESAAFEDAPRALIYVKDKEAAKELEKEFKKFTRYMDLRIFSAYDEPDIEVQKVAIYEGVDIVIATPKKLFKLFSITGINVSQLKLLIVEDAEFITNTGIFNDLIRIPQHISKCQYLVFASETNSKIERLRDSFMARAEVLKMK